MRAKHFLRGITAVSILYCAVGMMAAAKTQILEKPTEVQGMPCQGKVELNAHGGITSCTLSRDHVISGNLLPIGTRVVFSDAGALQRCKLGRDATVSGVTLPGNSTVFFNAQGQMDMCGLPTDTMIQGHLCKAGADAWCPEFYPDGKLRVAWLARDEEIDGVPCASASLGKEILRLVGVRAGKPIARFYHNGRLQYAMLARDATIQGHAFRKGESIDLSPDGKLDLRTQGK